MQVNQQKQLTQYLQEELALSKQQNETRLMEVSNTISDSHTPFLGEVKVPIKAA